MKKQIIQLLDFPTFYSTAKDSKLPLKTAYKISKLNKAVESEVQFYHDKLAEIIREYAKKDENDQFIFTPDGQSVVLREGSEQECHNKIKELQELEVTLPDVTFTLEEFDNVELSPSEVEAIIPFLQDEE